MTGANISRADLADLHRVLTATAREAGVQVEFRRTLTEIDRTDPSTVVARFADGAHGEGDVLIGCDGIRSRVRQLHITGRTRPAYSGLVDFSRITDSAVPIPPA